MKRSPRRTVRIGWLTLALFALAATVVLGLTGCGGGGTSVAPPDPTRLIGQWNYADDYNTITMTITADNKVQLSETAVMRAWHPPTLHGTGNGTINFNTGDYSGTIHYTYSTEYLDANFRGKVAPGADNDHLNVTLYPGQVTGHSSGIQPVDSLGSQMTVIFTRQRAASAASLVTNASRNPVEGFNLLTCGTIAGLR